MKRSGIRAMATVATGVLAILLGRPPGMADEGKDNPIDRVVGDYNVSYADRSAEKITGTATIHKDGTATVEYKGPTTHQSYVLKSESITAEGDLYTIVLHGASPPPTTQTVKKWLGNRNPEVDVFGLPKQNKRAFDLPVLELPANQQEVTVTTSGVSGTFATAGPQRQPLADVVELHLRCHPDSRVYAYLSGSWRVYVDPLTWRDANGWGRVGNLGRDPKDQNICAMAGSEEWRLDIPPCRLQFFAKCVGNFKKIDYLYAGVPTVVEMAFDGDWLASCPVCI